MAHKTPLVLALVAAAAPLAVAAQDRPAVAPPGGPDTRYCMHIEAVTGSRIERVRCWTRAEWAGQGVDVDHDWPAEGVRIV